MLTLIFNLPRLRDRDDDVRSAAAATLSPIADALVSSLPVELQQVVDVLWECLGDLKDDLSSSVGGVMDLLGALCSLNQLSAKQALTRLFVHSEAAGFPLGAELDAVARHGVRCGLLWRLAQPD